MFAVWEPILASDFGRPTTPVLGRLDDGRVSQFWDEQHVLASRMARDASSPQPRERCCTKNGHLWDLVAVYPPGAIWSEKLPPAILFDGPVAYWEAEMGDALTGKLQPKK